jgi:hypothetical protein
MTEPLLYYSAILDRVAECVPGFVFDGVSRPLLTYPTEESGIHDLLYRWPFPEVRFWVVADRVFNEAMKSNGVFIGKRWLKTSALFTVGWAFKKNMPGCLDKRFCNTYGPDCLVCPNYYPGWSSCLRKPTNADMELMQ